MRKIILIGYMAVGKTTIGELLSKKMQIEAIDLDRIIENTTGLSIPNIFERNGEVYFRKIEHKIFKKSVEESKELIIITGGGTPCYANNHLLLNAENVISIYLKASIDVIFDRLKSEKEQRPLVANQSGADLKEFIAKHLFERSYFYNKALFTVNVDGKSPEVIVEEILRLLN